MYQLDAQLEADTYRIGQTRHSDLLLMDNANFPWLIMVPRMEELVELTDLPPDDYVLLMQEIYAVSAAIKEHANADKMNIAALGNQVKQLHIHIIARFEDDIAWPKPVWGAGRLPYTQETLETLMQATHQALDGILTKKA